MQATRTPRYAPVVTHEMFRALVPSYAAGALDAPEAEAARGHLAECRACLVEFLARPPRAGQVEGPQKPPVGVRPAVTVSAALAFALAIGTLVTSSYERERAGTRQATLRRRFDGLARKLARARTETRAQAERLRVAEDTRREVEAALADAEGRAATLASSVPAALLRSPGLQLMPLTPVAPFHDAGGHVLWHPGDETMLLYAHGLPAVPPDSPYHVRLFFGGHLLRSGPSFKPTTPEGDVAVAIPLSHPPVGLRKIEVVWGEPPPVIVLLGRTASQETRPASSRG